MKRMFYSHFFLVVCIAILFSCSRDKGSLNNPVSDRDNDVKIAYSKQIYADNLVSKGVYDSAYVYYNEGKQLFEKHNDSIYVVYALAKMAQIQQNFGDYFGGEATATEALPLLKAEGTEMYHVSVYNVLGRCYRKLFDYQSAIYYYNKSTEVTKDSLAKCVVYSNIASVYADQKKYTKALEVLEKINQSDIVANDKEVKARILNNIGHIYFILNEPIAEDYLLKGYKLRKENNDLHGLISSYLELAELYSKTNKTLSNNYAQKALDLSAKIKSQDDRLLALRLLLVNSGNEERELRTSQFLTLSDSLDRVKLNAKSEFAKVKYDSKVIEQRLKEEEIRHQLTVQKSKNRIYLISMGAFFTIVAIGAFFYIKRIKYRKERLLQVYTTETRISKKIHDELANDVFKVMSFAESQDFTSLEQQQKLLKNLDTIYTKTRDISRENNSIDTGENFASGLREMLADYKTGTINVMLVSFNSIVWSDVSEPKKITVYRVLQELMVNMKKHSQATIVVVKFDVEGKKALIKYSDNGIGLANNKVIFKNGLQNAETRMKSVNGYITFDNEPGKGLKATLEFTL